MSRRAWLAALLAVATLLAACAKPLPPENRDLVGWWEAPGMKLVITAEGNVSYERVGPNGNVSIDAPMQQVRKDGFSVGVGPMTTDFRLDKPPHAENGVWTMTVDGVVLTRRDEGAQPMKPL